MNRFRRVNRIEHILADLKPRRWPFKGSWRRSGKRGVSKSRQQRWLRKAQLGGSWPDATAGVG